MVNKKNKNAPRNGFYYFMLDYQQANHIPDLRKVAIYAEPLWNKMDKEERVPFEQLAAAKARENPDKLTSQGIPVSEIEKRKKQEEEEMIKMETEIKNMVDELIREDDIMKTHLFYFLHVNIYCRIDLGFVVPAELALSEFSLQDGIRRIYHTFVNMREIPQGYSCVAKDHAKISHKIPLPPLPGANQDAKDLVFKMRRFIDGKAVDGFDYVDWSSERPLIMFTSQKEFKVTKESIDAILKDSMLRCALPFRVYPLEVLFFHLHNALAQYRGQPILTRSMIDCEIEKDVHCYYRELACDLHKKNDAEIFCSRSIVHRWGFYVADFCCKFYGIELIDMTHCKPNSNRNHLASTQPLLSIVSDLHMPYKNQQILNKFGNQQKGGAPSPNRNQHGARKPSAERGYRWAINPSPNRNNHGNNSNRERGRGRRQGGSRDMREEEEHRDSRHNSPTGCRDNSPHSNEKGKGWNNKNSKNNNSNRRGEMPIPRMEDYENDSDPLDHSQHPSINWNKGPNGTPPLGTSGSWPNGTPPSNCGPSPRQNGPPNPNGPPNLMNSPQFGHNTPQLGPNGQKMGHNGPQLGDNGQQLGHNGEQLGHGQQLVSNRQQLGPNGLQLGPNGQQFGPNGFQFGHNGLQLGPNGLHMGPNGQQLGPNGIQLGLNASQLSQNGPQTGPGMEPEFSSPPSLNGPSPFNGSTPGPLNGPFPSLNGPPPGFGSPPGFNCPPPNFNAPPPMTPNGFSIGQNGPQQGVNGSVGQQMGPNGFPHVPNVSQSVNGQPMGLNGYNGPPPGQNNQPTGFIIRPNVLPGLNGPLPGFNIGPNCTPSSFNVHPGPNSVSPGFNVHQGPNNVPPGFNVHSGPNNVSPGFNVHPGPNNVPPGFNVHSGPNNVPPGFNVHPGPNNPMPVNMNGPPPPLMGPPTCISRANFMRPPPSPQLAPVEDHSNTASPANNSVHLNIASPCLTNAPDWQNKINPNYQNNQQQNVTLANWQQYANVNTSCSNCQNCGSKTQNNLPLPPSNWNVTTNSLPPNCPQNNMTPSGPPSQSVPIGPPSSVPCETPSLSSILSSVNWDALRQWQQQNDLVISLQASARKASQVTPCSITTAVNKDTPSQPPSDTSGPQMTPASPSVQPSTQARIKLPTQRSIPVNNQITKNTNQQNIIDPSLNLYFYSADPRVKDINAFLNKDPRQKDRQSKLEIGGYDKEGNNNQERGGDRSNARGEERGGQMDSERSGERGGQRDGERGSQMDSNRGWERGGQRDIESGEKRGGQMDSERGGQRDSERCWGKRGQRDSERGGDKGVETVYEKGVGKGGERDIERGGNKGSNHKGSEKGHERGGERGYDKSRERSGDYYYEKYGKEKGGERYVDKYSKEKSNEHYLDKYGRDLRFRDHHNRRYHERKYYKDSHRHDKGKLKKRSSDRKRSASPSNDSEVDEKMREREEEIIRNKKIKQEIKKEPVEPEEPKEPQESEDDTLENGFKQYRLIKIDL